MSDHETFADGFREGYYKAIMGNGAAKGVEAAMRRKQAQSSSSN